MSEASHFQTDLTVEAVHPSTRLEAWNVFHVPAHQLIGTPTTLACQQLPIRASLKAFPFSFFFSFFFFCYEAFPCLSLPLSLCLCLFSFAWCLFPYSILKTSDGVSIEMHSCDSCTREVKIPMSCFSFQGKIYMTPMHQPRASSRASLGLSLMPSALPPCGQNPILHWLLISIGSLRNSRPVYCFVTFQI